jgi:two-component system, NarL family, nitrate/nitrite response regulator NarL
VHNPPLYSVLLVEHDSFFQATIERVLEKMDGMWRLNKVQDGLDALATIGEQGDSISLALIDIDLADISGIELIAAVSRRFPKLPIMVITAVTDEDKFLSAIRAGAHGYLTTEVEETVLQDSIAQIMLGQYPVCSSLARHLFRLAGSPIAAHDTKRLNLTSRELELLSLLAIGHSYTSCAEQMRISLSTIQTHIRNMYRKLNVSNQRQAIRKAQSCGILNY